ncbi:ATP-binding protein [Mucilaginibacter xinganensis]|uniref:Molecular chaperone of HSP90 family n=1 Tax=Mucilaginibacter xinganensis TaxID=1234841 RepID=A0A223NWK6_9SPHI|nr:ATP-binding protein [Mucilaginibacter xinganensis]ASU34245.1 molecular chaperone of HSP90 family [Mucilaginibacter xinganensis]
MKQLLKDIEALPSKRIYLSIIADYHIKTALCELIDNSIDSWIHRGKQHPLEVSIELDYQRQVIQVIDNSGGVPEADINLIVSPGHSRNTAEDATIGIFGVGSKRAVVALAEEIRIFTRYKDEKTILVEIDDAWIKDDSTWDLHIYEVDPIPENTTKIELIKLRDPIKPENEADLKNHLGVTYGLFLADVNFQLKFNGNDITPIYFDKWSYPPDFEPKEFTGDIDFGADGKIKLDILGGLTKSGEPSGGEYGAYFYCNNRLITKAYKGPEVGYKPLRIGNPHPSVSLARVIVKLTGPAKLMPWNSSKSDINPKHPSFREIQEHIDRVLTHYSTLSKKWSSAGGWEENIFKYDDGIINEEVLTNISSQVRLYLPPIPRPSKRKYGDIIKINNRALAKNKPWVTGLYETVIAVEEIGKLKLEQKNRISMLTLDSMLEIAFKEYLINDSGTSYSATRLENIMKNRTDVHAEVKNTVSFTQTQWKKIEYYYKLRSELVHKRATVTVSDSELATFRKVVEVVLKKLFGLNFKTDN